MDIKEIWQIFKVSSTYDKDMQAVFRRHATPNACIELLEENEQLRAENEALKASITDIEADAYWKGYVAGGDDFRRRISIPLKVVTKKANELIIKLYPDSESARKIRQAAKEE